VPGLVLKDMRVGAEYVVISPHSDRKRDRCCVVELLGDGWVLVSFDDGERRRFSPGGLGKVSEPVPPNEPD